MNQIYNILEVANTHSGDINYIFKLLDEFSSFRKDSGIKFQPFKYDEIATDNYEWFPIYKKLFFTQKQWVSIINEASKTKDVWLDVSTEYSCKILQKNKNLIKGIKFQSSILDNYNLINNLKDISIIEKIVIVNVSGLSLIEIEKNLDYINRILSPKEIIIQIGFQDYPTQLIDSGISKLKLLQEHFTNKISFADHLSPESDDSVWLPLISTLLGVSVIEKHIRHSTLETKYDFYSSMNSFQYQHYLNKLDEYNSLASQNFINEAEKKYLRKSAMIPITVNKLNKGQLVNTSDICFKRTNSFGMNISELKQLQDNFHILRNNKESEETFKKDDFKKATIATIIACRLKSTRLPKKAILKVNDNLTSIELCQKNALKMENVNYTILATSNLDDDSILEQYVYNDVIFHKGDPIDVIDRYMDVINDLKIDVVLRLTGDCPYPSNQITQFLLKSHFENGADYSQVVNSSPGTAPQIINTFALRKVKQLFPITDFSEYMNGYIIHNPDYFKINYVELPDELLRDYRLTLDYQDDLDLIRKIEAHFHAAKIEYTTEDVFEFLDANPNIAEINQNMELIFETNLELKNKIKEATTYKKIHV